MPDQLTKGQRKQLKAMLRRQRKLLLRKEREKRNGRRLLQRLSVAAAAKAPAPVLNPHERRLLQKMSDEGMTPPPPRVVGMHAHERYRSRLLGTFGPASPVRRIDPKTGQVR